MGEILWQPSEEQVQNSTMMQFMNRINAAYNKNFKQYADLYEWSIENIPEFWAEMWNYADIVHSRAYDQVVDDPYKMPGAKWFAGARLNFAENLLRFRDDHTAMVFMGESMPVRRLTYAELYRAVSRVAQALKKLDIQPEDRVVGFMPNMPETIIAMLAGATMGATWSSCSPDFGIQGVLDRFGQIEPRVLFVSDGYFYKGKHIDNLERVSRILKELPSVEQVVVVPYTSQNPDISSVPRAVLYADFIAGTSDDAEIDFLQLPFAHPHYIMYSSGTTGPPKCMVQGAGGVLIQQVKEHMLHVDLKREDNLFYVTTCGWMMWNWLTCGLSQGATITLYDGNPFHPDPEVLWRLAEKEKITIFGTSAGYIGALRNAGARPGSSYDLSALKAVLSTGSPLDTEGFKYVYREIKEDLQLASISGGTDINACFFLGNPMGPVYTGELQCRGLAMKVKAYDENGQPVYNQPGELVCEASVPSMPLYFWKDPDGSKYHSAYFDMFPGVWAHGDYIEINDHGGVIIYGRSDATLNPGGVRIGTAEIYRQVEKLHEIEDSIVTGYRVDGDEKVVLFVKMKPGYELDQDMEKKIKTTIRENTTPRHVPAKICAVPDIPYTLNMKKVELAVKKILHGNAVLNKEALSNPECLSFYEEWKDQL
ncbi:MAG: acetoacetate--CoA ligase [Desulfobacterales bacterium]|nr:acetoacetate--CoA ligase [Desulfobacterales bacterium]